MSTFTMKQVMQNPAMRAAYLAARGKATAAEPRRPVIRNAMNKLELAYAKELDIQKAAGIVKWWAFNSIRLRIAMGEKAAWYKADFIVDYGYGTFQFHETKGFEREAAMLRLKVAAGMYPFTFKLVKRDGDGWSYEEFKGCA